MPNFVHADRAVLREELSGTSKEKLAYAPDWMFNLTMRPVLQKLAEDISFQKATPSGHAEYQIDNPKAAEQLVIGKQYYVDFTMVPDPAPAA